jgi:hypothetical protein
MLKIRVRWLGQFLCWVKSNTALAEPVAHDLQMSCDRALVRREGGILNDIKRDSALDLDASVSSDLIQTQANDGRQDGEK